MYSRLFRNAHHPSHCAGAACGGLNPDPAIRVRGAHPHLLCSRLLRVGFTWLPPLRAVVAHDRRHSARRSCRRSPWSGAISGPTGRKRSAGRRWQGLVRSPRPAHVLGTSLGATEVTTKPTTVPATNDASAEESVEEAIGRLLDSNWHWFRRNDHQQHRPSVTMSFWSGLPTLNQLWRTGRGRIYLSSTYDA